MFMTILIKSFRDLIIYRLSPLSMNSHSVILALNNFLSIYSLHIPCLYFKSKIVNRSKLNGELYKNRIFLDCINPSWTGTCIIKKLSVAVMQRIIWKNKYITGSFSCSCLMYYYIKASVQHMLLYCNVLGSVL
jgi:hypothetical protein